MKKTTVEFVDTDRIGQNPYTYREVWGWFYRYEQWIKEKGRSVDFADGSWRFSAGGIYEFMVRHQAANVHLLYEGYHLRGLARLTIPNEDRETSACPYVHVYKGVEGDVSFNDSTKRLEYNGKISDILPEGRCPVVEWGQEHVAKHFGGD